MTRKRPLDRQTLAATVAEHLYAVTGVSLPYYQAGPVLRIKPETLPRGALRIPIHYFLDFIPVTPLRLVAIRAGGFCDPAAGSSLNEGFLIGHLVLDSSGRIRQGLNRHHAALVRYLQETYTGACRIRLLNDDRFALDFPHGLGPKLVARLAKLEKKTPAVRASAEGWTIRVGTSSVAIDPYGYTYSFHLSPAKAARMLGLGENAWETARQIDRPALFYAFDRFLGLFRPQSPDPGNTDFVPDRLLFPAFQDFAELRDRFLAGARPPPLPAFTLPAIDTSRSTLRFQMRGEPEPDASPRAVRALLAFQRRILTSCVGARPTRIRLGRRTIRGRLSVPDPYCYPPVWSDDHFMNAMAVSFFDRDLAREMIRTGFAVFQIRGGRHDGLMFKKCRTPRMKGVDAETLVLDPPAAPVHLQPLWALLVGAVHLNLRDPAFLQECWPHLIRNHRAIRRDLFARTPHADVRTVYWNDYGESVPGEKRISVGFNAIVLLNTKVLAWIAGLLGKAAERSRLEAEAHSLAQTIDGLFWDETRGIYADADRNGGRPVSDAQGLGIDNLLPLAAGVPSPERAARLRALLERSDAYGRYPCYTSDLSGHRMNARGAMVWAHTNWLVQLGLRSYGFHDLAAKNSRNLALSLLHLHQRQGALPEALDALHGMGIAENPVLAGEGHAGFAEIFCRDCFRGEYLVLDHTGLRLEHRGRTAKRPGGR